jgi:PAS domain S-box-containing protein
MVDAEAAALEAARTQAELDALRGHEERLRTITDNVPALIGYIDAEQRFRFNNLAYENWYQRPRGEITGRVVREVIGEAAYREVRPHLERALAGGRITFQVAFSVNGEMRHAQTTYLPDFDRGGRVRGVFVAAKDIGPQVAAQEALEAANRRLESALADRNRLELFDRVRQALARARRSGAGLALLSIEVAGAGAEQLRGCVRATDTVAQTGEQRFMALLEGLKERGDAFQVADKVRRAMRDAHVGIAFPDEGEQVAETLVERADAALGEAKASGKGVS